MLTFAWDERKAAANLKKHGVSFDEAHTVFSDIRIITARKATRHEAHNYGSFTK
jgi:uncharacterized DUF497 family protein